jgi:hypothetical protein
MLFHHDHHRIEDPDRGRTEEECVSARRGRIPGSLGGAHTPPHRKRTSMWTAMGSLALMLQVSTSGCEP